MFVENISIIYYLFPAFRQTQSGDERNLILALDETSQKRLHEKPKCTCISQMDEGV